MAPGFFQELVTRLDVTGLTGLDLPEGPPGPKSRDYPREDDQSPFAQMKREMLANTSMYVHIRGKRQRVIYAMTDREAIEGRTFCVGDRLWEIDDGGMWKRLVHENKTEFTQNF